ncbi:hypothetical protein FFI89_027505 [Bradyrhizobium sp. KBS0727]|uniref:hypothetical protein n=1 Tax=unclassified Bradyrhizobium TaxID=2631580 RepID=UPI00110ECC73|nr:MULTISPECIES: hypothetical protein [unclassified Bradyrhizobium]QDW40539.1 hypothetical protein FFI71_027510 [Bradyrhizobium sp. KBS0725]QDW47144.1 hypothetical protein FFI89_027505 [Bradyrhizobium sp. KBS0727]
MSKYYVNKFLYTVDRDPDLLKQYRENPRALVARWEQAIGPRLNDYEATTVTSLSDSEREALIAHDYVALFEMGAHFFLSLTIFIGIYDDEWTNKHGPLSFQREFAAKLRSWIGRQYPSVET